MRHLSIRKRAQTASDPSAFTSAIRSQILLFFPSPPHDLASPPLFLSHSLISIPLSVHLEVRCQHRANAHARRAMCHIISSTRSRHGRACAENQIASVCPVIFSSKTPCVVCACAPGSLFTVCLCFLQACARETITLPRSHAERGSETRQGHITLQALINSTTMEGGKWRENQKKRATKSYRDTGRERGKDCTWILQLPLEFQPVSVLRSKVSCTW